MSQDLLVDPSCNNQTSGCLLKIGVNKLARPVGPLDCVFLFSVFLKIFFYKNSLFGVVLLIVCIFLYAFEEW
jgi:hypothetical protein